MGRQLEAGALRTYSVIGKAFLERNNELSLDGLADWPLELSYEQRNSENGMHVGL